MLSVFQAIPLSYENATHGKLVGPTLSTPRGDKYYNQYRPLCEVWPRDRGKVIGTLAGNMQTAQSNLTYQLRPAQSVPSQMPQVENLSYNPSQLRSAIQSAPNQIQTQNAYQSPG